MRYGQIRPYDTANGPGIRTSVFFTGCTHGCFGCFNEEYQSFQAGNPFTKKEEVLILSYLKRKEISGLTILGGEPMQQNAKEMIDFLSSVKEVSKDIWVYSGYTFEEIMACPAKKGILSFCDVLVDGKFIHSLKNLNLRFRGSENQRILDIKKSIQKGEAVLFDL